MTGLYWASIGVLVGGVFVAAWLNFAVIRPMRAARNQAREDARLLRAAVSPFAGHVDAFAHRGVSRG